MIKNLRSIVKLSNNFVAILTLHRIGIRDRNRIPANQNMVIEPKELDLFIENCKNKGWKFISLDDLLNAHKNKTQLSKSLIITFDDGYLDNFTNASPILFKHKVPFAVYISTGFIESELIPWWYKLESILNKSKKIETIDQKIINTSNVHCRQNAFMYIRSEYMKNSEGMKSWFEWIEKNYTNPSIEIDRLFMDWKEIKELATSSLVTIGCHTNSHPVLSKLTDFEAYNEIMYSKEILESKIGNTIRHFAFPYGGDTEVSEREYRNVKNIGFESAVTTQNGFINFENLNLFRLPRCNYIPNRTIDNLKFNFILKQLRDVIKGCKN